MLRTISQLIYQDARYLNVAYQMYKLKHETQSVILTRTAPDIEFSVITDEDQWHAIKGRLFKLSVTLDSDPILLNDVEISNVYLELEKLACDFFIAAEISPMEHANLWQRLVYSFTGEEIDLVNLAGGEYDFFLKERWILMILLLEQLPSTTFGIKATNE
jgi:hypothetical protein